MGKKDVIDETCIKLTISLSKFAYETLNLSNVINRSRYIEKLAVLGLESELKNDLTIKSRLARAVTHDLKVAKEEKKEKRHVEWDR